MLVQSLNLNALSSGFADVYFSKLSVTLSKLGKGKHRSAGVGLGSLGKRVVLCAAAQPDMAVSFSMASTSTAAENRTNN